MRAPILEKIVKKRLKALLARKREESGRRMWWMAVSDRYHSGVPDFMMVWDGQVHFIEAKSSIGTLSKMQYHIALQLVSAGAKYWVVRPKKNGMVFEEYLAAGAGPPRSSPWEDMVSAV